MSSIGIEEFAEHNNFVNIFVVDSLPETIILLIGSLTKNSKGFIIDYRLDFISIDIVRLNFRNFQSAVLIFLKQ